ncbi:MAG: hypothetical protein EAX96_06555 [Candidatus Lokiarchaeota archaeon]|nr:hypothetical protein [Candidatus Lokiarchaeota archaeon]
MVKCYICGRPATSSCIYCFAPVCNFHAVGIDKICVQCQSDACTMGASIIKKGVIITGLFGVMGIVFLFSFMFILFPSF